MAQDISGYETSKTNQDNYCQVELGIIVSDILSLNMGEVVFIAAQLKSRFFFVPANCLLFYFHQFDGFCKYPLQLHLLWLPTGSLTLCMLGHFFLAFFWRSKFNFSKNSFSDVTISNEKFGS